MLGLIRRRSSRSTATPAPAAASSLDDFSSTLHSLGSLFHELRHGTASTVNVDTLYEQCKDQLPDMERTLHALLRAVRSKPRAFISHFKSQAGTSAQLLCSMMEQNGLECFLDSDDLESLDQLVYQVMSSTVVFVLMSPYEEEDDSSSSSSHKFGPFGRPYCLVELVTWYLHRASIQARVVWLKQHGKPTARFPQSQEEMTAVLDEQGWRLVKGALGRTDAAQLAFRAAQELQQQQQQQQQQQGGGLLEWEPNHADRQTARQQLHRIFESTGLELRHHADDDAALVTSTRGDHAPSAATAKTNSTATTSTRRLQISLLYCADDASDEASLFATRTETEFPDQVEILSSSTAMGVFAVVLMTPKMLHDDQCLRAIARAVEARVTLVPVLISRIGLTAFDYSQSPAAAAVADKKGEETAAAFAQLKTILAKPLAPHSSSNQVSVQLGAIWGAMGLSTAQFRGVLPSLQDAFSLVVNKSREYVPGTRAWVFDQLLAAPQLDDDNVFVLQATAGLGKSVVMAELCKRYSTAVAARTKSASSTSPAAAANVDVVALHFFKHDDTSLNDARVAIGSIARQLANTVDGFRVSLENSLQACTSDELKDLETLFRKAILEPAKKTDEMTAKGGGGGAMAVVVLDGLDECLDRQELAKLLASLWPQVPRLRLVLSSRPSGDRWDRFPGLIIKPDDANNLKDLRVYLAHKLEGGGREAAAAAAVDIVANNANGLFLYAMFACSQLASAAASKTITTTGGSFDLASAARNLPVSMDGIYIDYFSTLHDQMHADPMLYVGALAPVLASRVPIPETIWMEACIAASTTSFTLRVPGSQLSELKVAIEFKKRVREPLLRLLDFTNGCVSFLHKSMGDFLQSASSSSHAELHVSKQVGHELLATVCSAYRFPGESWDKFPVASMREDVFVAAHSLYHFAQLAGLNQPEYLARAVECALDIDRLMRNIRVAQLDSNYGRLLDDVQSVIELQQQQQQQQQAVPLLEFTHSLLVLAERAVMNDPREFVGQVLGRVMIPEFDADQLHWVKQAQSWLERAAAAASVRVPVPAFFGRSGLQPAGTALLRLLTRNPANVTGVAIAPDSSFAATAAGASVKLSDLKTGRVIQSLHSQEPNCYFRAMAITPDSLYVATGASNGKVRLWDARTGQQVRKVAQEKSEVTAIAVSSAAAGQYLVTGEKSNLLTVYDLFSSRAAPKKGQKKHVAASLGGDDDAAIVFQVGHGNPITSVAIAPNLSCVACTLAGSSLTLVYQLVPDKGNNPKLVTTIKGHSKTVFCVAYSPDSSLLCTGSDDKTAVLWDTKTYKRVHALACHSWGVVSVQFAPHGRTVITGSQDKLIRLFDVSSGELLTTLRGHDNHVTSLAVSADFKYILSGSTDKTSRLWDANSTRALRQLEAHKGGVKSVSVSPAGTEMCTASNDRSIKVWDLATNAATSTLYASAEGILVAKYSPDGLTIAAGGYSKLVYIWREGKVVRSLEGLDSQPRLLLFTPDSRYVMAKPWDRQPVAWDVETGLVVADKPQTDFVEQETVLATSKEGFVMIAEEQTDKDVGLTLDIENQRLIKYGDKLLGSVGEGFEYWTLGESECRGMI